MAGQLDQVGLDAVIQGVNAYLANSQKLIASNQRLGQSTKSAAQSSAQGAQSTSLFGKVAALVSPKILAYAGAIGAAVAAFASYKTIVSATQATAEYGMQVLSVMRLTGLTAEATSRLLFAFHHVGLEADTFSTIVRIFSKRLIGVQDEETGVVAGGKNFIAVLNEMGVAVVDSTGKLLPFDQILPQIADAFQKMPNSIEKTGRASQIFARNGAALIPLLNLGSKGLAALGAEADKLGVTLTSENVAAVLKYVQAHRDWQEALKGVKLQIGLALMPVMTRLTGFLIQQAPLMHAVARAFLVAAFGAAELARMIARNPPILVGIAVAITAVLIPAFIALAVAMAPAVGEFLLLAAPVLVAAAALGAFAGAVTFFVMHGDATKQALRTLRDGFLHLGIDILRAWAEIPRLTLRIGADIINAIGRGIAGAAHGLFTLVASVRNGMIKLLNPFNWVFGSDIVDVYMQAGKEAGDALMTSLIHSFDAQIGAVVEAAREPLTQYRKIVDDLQGEMSRLAALPTKQSAFGDLIHATLELRKLNLTPAVQMQRTSRNRPAEAETKGVDAQLTALDQLNQKRKLEHDILVARGQLADKTLATDQQVAAAMDKLVGNISLVTDAVSLQASNLQTVFIPSWELAADKTGAGADAISADVAGLSTDLNTSLDDMNRQTNEEINRMMERWKNSFRHAMLDITAIMSLGLGPLIWIVYTHMGKITEFFTEAFDGDVLLAKDFAKGMLKAVEGVGSGMANLIINGFKDAWNAGAGAINSLLHKIDFSVGKGKFKFTVDLTGVSIPTFDTATAPPAPAAPVGPVPPQSYWGGGNWVGPRPPGYGEGGMIPGKLGQAMSIIAHGGEVVFTPRQMRRLEGVASLGAGVLAMLAARGSGGGMADSRMINYGHQTFTLPQDTNAPFVRAMMRGLG